MPGSARQSIMSGSRLRFQGVWLAFQNITAVQIDVAMITLQSLFDLLQLTTSLNYRFLEPLFSHCVLQSSVQLAEDAVAPGEGGCLQTFDVIR